MQENIVSWSHSKLGDFERCRFACKLKHLDRIPEPERPLPPGKTEHANDRGSRIHDNCELYVAGLTDDLAPEAELYFGPEIDLLRVLHEQGHVLLEGEWGMDRNWEVAEWKSAWLRLKLDVAVLLDDEAVVIDYKTGKKFGNEVKHAEQLQLYAVVTALRYPHVKRITSELWYLDQNEVSRMSMTRDQALRFRAGFHKRGLALTTCTDWKPNPSRFVCKWCQYGPWNGGQCEVGVR